MTLYKYLCTVCDVAVWVDWEAYYQYQFPCCAECGSNEKVKFEEKSIEIKEEN